MPNDVEKVIIALTEAFNKKFEDFNGMYLFGVHLDGKLHKFDDIELVAIFDTEDKSKRETIWPLIGKIETEMDVCVDLYPYTQAEFEADEELYEQVMEEGVFYDKNGEKNDNR